MKTTTNSNVLFFVTFDKNSNDMLYSFGVENENVSPIDALQSKKRMIEMQTALKTSAITPVLIGTFDDSIFIDKQTNKINVKLIKKTMFVLSQFISENPPLKDVVKYISQNQTSYDCEACDEPKTRQMLETYEHCIICLASNLMCIANTMHEK